jgi:CRISPR-associated protein Csb2
MAHYLRFSLQCRVPVLPKFTVPLAEQFRKAAISHFSKEFGDGESSFALFGHPNDRPKDAVGDHQHAFYLPTRSFASNEEAGQPGTITDLHIWCPYGFTRTETQILLRIQRLTWKDGRYPVHPLLIAMGMELPAEVPLATGRVRSRVWRSETPFVPPWHFYRGDRSKPKMRELDSPERQLIKCLRQAGVALPGEVRRLSLSEMRLEPIESLPPTPLWSIVRAPDAEEAPFADAVTSPAHSNGSIAGHTQYQQRIGFFMEIRFASEVALPMPAFGHSAHFGLGLFVPAE